MKEKTKMKKMKKTICYAFLTLLALMICVSCSCSKENPQPQNGGESVDNSQANKGEHEHYWTQGKIVVEATVEMPGLMSYTCAICKEVREEQIPKVAHQHTYSNEWLSNEMSHWYACDVKNCTVKGSKGAHTWDDGEILVESNQTTTGLKRFTCTTCRYTKEEEYRASAKVTKDEFEFAISSDAFENVTIKIIKEDLQMIIKLSDGKREVEGDLWEISIGDSLEYESFVYDEKTRAYLFDAGNAKYSCQFADGKLSVFTQVRDGVVLKIEFSCYGKTVISETSK